MNRKFYLVAAALAAMSLASCTSLAGSAGNGVCEKPTNGTEVAQGKCVFYNSTDESARMARHAAGKNASDAAAKAEALGKRADKTGDAKDREKANEANEISQKARDFSRNLNSRVF